MGQNQIKAHVVILESKFTALLNRYGLFYITARTKGTWRNSQYNCMINDLKHTGANLLQP